MSNWIIFYITLLNWEFLLKWYNFFWKFCWNREFSLCTTISIDKIVDSQTSFMLRSRTFYLRLRIPVCSVPPTYRKSSTCYPPTRSTTIWRLPVQACWRRLRATAGTWKRTDLRRRRGRRGNWSPCVSASAATASDRWGWWTARAVGRRAGCFRWRTGSGGAAGRIRCCCCCNCWQPGKRKKRCCAFKAKSGEPSWRHTRKLWRHSRKLSDDIVASLVATWSQAYKNAWRWLLHFRYLLLSICDVRSEYFFTNINYTPTAWMVVKTVIPSHLAETSASQHAQLFTWRTTGDQARRHGGKFGGRAPPNLFCVQKNLFWTQKKILPP